MNQIKNSDTPNEMIQNKNNTINYNWINFCNKFIDEHLDKELKNSKGLFLPGDDFYVGGEPREILVYMASKIMDWLDIELKQDELTLDFYDKMEPPGLYTEIDGQKYILINSKHKNDVFAIGAILAHEIMHFYLLSKKNIKIDDVLKNELLTDLCTIRLGLGLPILNGMSYSNNWFLSVLLIFVGILHWKSQKLSFGYFNPDQYGQMIHEDIQKRKIALYDIGGYIQPYSRNFISHSFAFTTNIKNTSKLINELSKRKRRRFLIQITILLIIGVLIFYTNEKEQIINQQQETRLQQIEETELYLDNEKQKMENLVVELENIEKQMNNYEKTNDIEEYNKLVPIYNSKVEEIQKYRDVYNEYGNMINEYNKNI